jgi:hypothetical protein
MILEVVIDRVQCFLKWNGARFDALDEAHEAIVRVVRRRKLG